MLLSPALGSMCAGAGRAVFFLITFFDLATSGAVAIDASVVSLVEAGRPVETPFVMGVAFWGGGSLTTTSAAAGIGGAGLVTASRTGAGSATSGVEVCLALLTLTLDWTDGLGQSRE
jgi:hypothetical protein